MLCLRLRGAARFVGHGFLLALGFGLGSGVRGGSVGALLARPPSKGLGGVGRQCGGALDALREVRTRLQDVDPCTSQRSSWRRGEQRSSLCRTANLSKE